MHTNLGIRYENMFYEPNEDYYICPNQKKLQAVGTAHRTYENGYKTELIIYECENCTGCAYKEKCTKAKGNRQMRISKEFIARREASYQNIKTELGTQLRMNRSIQVEGTFGVIKCDREFSRFLRRGKTTSKLNLCCFVLLII